MVKKLAFVGLLTVLLFACVVTINAKQSKSQPPTAVVLDFTNSTTHSLYKIGQYTNQYLSVLLEKTGKFTMVEREKLKTIVKELKFSLTSGLVSEKSRVLKLGKMLDAQYIFTGSIMSLDTEEIHYEGYGIETTTFKATLESMVKVLNVMKGTVVFSDLASASTETTKFGYTHVEESGLVRKLVADTLRQFCKDILKEDFVTTTPEKQKKVQVKFESKPAHASVILDGHYIGSTPLEYVVTQGIHTVRVTMGGYKAWEHKIKAYEGLVIKAVLGKNGGQ